MSNECIMNVSSIHQAHTYTPMAMYLPPSIKLQGKIALIPQTAPQPQLQSLDLSLPTPLLYPSQDLERVIETVWTRKSVVSSLFIYAVSTMKPGDSIRAAKLSSGGSSHHSLPENGGKDKVIMAWSASPRPKSNCLRDLIQGDWYLLTSVNLSNTQSENV